MFFYPQKRDLDDTGTTVTAWTYDANGNRLSATGTTTTFTGSYDAQDKLLTYGNGVTTSTFAYNANSERIRRTDETSTTTLTTSYAYDVQGNLTSATLPSGERIEYVYDAFGRRIARKKFDAAGSQISVQRFLYAGLGAFERPIAMVDADGNVLQEYTYFTKSHVPDIVTIGGVDCYTITDERGSVRAMMNGYYGYYGENTQLIEWDEFGNCLSDTTSGFQPFGFAGSFYDPDLKLHHLGAREYDPTIGRWLQPDPIGLEGGLNLYAYCDNDPINGIDPTGLAILVFTRNLALTTGWRAYVLGTIAGIVGLAIGDPMTPIQYQERTWHAGIIIAPRAKWDNSSSKLDFLKAVDSSCTWELQNDKPGETIKHPAEDWKKGNKFDPSNFSRYDVQMIYGDDSMDDGLTQALQMMKATGRTYKTSSILGPSYNCCDFVREALAYIGIYWENPNPCPFK